MPVVTALRATRRGRVAVHVDGEYLCAVSEAAVARWHLRKGLELDEAGLRSLVADASVELALADAHRLLGLRARGTAELRRRLAAKEHAADAVEAAVQKLLEQGLLDDAAFARSYVADKRRLAGWGTERIRRGLTEYGVARECIAAALGDAESGDADDGEVRRALEVLRRRASRTVPPDDAARRRAYQLLLRRGFASEVAYAAVRAWVASPDDSPDDAPDIPHDPAG